MAEPVETIEVDSTFVNCDGGGGALGHPRVYLQINAGAGALAGGLAGALAGALDCPYCGRRYVLKRDAKAATAAGH